MRGIQHQQKIICLVLYTDLLLIWNILNTAGFVAIHDNMQFIIHVKYYKYILDLVKSYKWGSTQISKQWVKTAVYDSELTAVLYLKRNTQK